MTDEHIQNEGGGATKKAGFWGREQPNRQTLGSDRDQEDQAPTGDGPDQEDQALAGDGLDEEGQAPTGHGLNREEAVQPEMPLANAEAEDEEVVSEREVVAYDAGLEQTPVADEGPYSEPPASDKTAPSEDSTPYEASPDNVYASYENVEGAESTSDETDGQGSPVSNGDGEAPTLSWDEDERGDDSRFFGGTSSAYSSYIEDSPAYTPMPSAYDMADAVRPKRNGNVIRIVVIVVCVVVALVVIYILGVRRFSNRFLPNTRINGFDVSGKTLDEARADLEKQTSDYECNVVVGDFSASVRGADIGMERNEEHMASDEGPIGVLLASCASDSEPGRS